VLEASFATEKAASAAAQAAVVGAALLAEAAKPGPARDPVKERPPYVHHHVPWAEEDELSSCISGWDTRCDAQARWREGVAARTDWWGSSLLFL